MHPPPSAAAMDFSQNSLFGYTEDLQELTIIERPVRRSLKVRAPGRRSCPLGARPRTRPWPCGGPSRCPAGPSASSARRVTQNRPFRGPFFDAARLVLPA